MTVYGPIKQLLSSIFKSYEQFIVNKKERNKKTHLVMPQFWLTFFPLPVFTILIAPTNYKL